MWNPFPHLIFLMAASHLFNIKNQTKPYFYPFLFDASLIQQAMITLIINSPSYPLIYLSVLKLEIT